MIHNIKDIPNNLKNVDVIVFGHSHKYFYEVIDNISYLNPGSCGKKRFNLPINFVIMTIKNKDYNIEIIKIKTFFKKYLHIVIKLNKNNNNFSRKVLKIIVI